MTKNKTQGGKRSGAGRPKQNVGRVACRLDNELIDLMKSKGYTAREALEWAIPKLKSRAIED